MLVSHTIANFCISFNFDFSFLNFSFSYSEFKSAFDFDFDFVKFFSLTCDQALWEDIQTRFLDRAQARMPFTSKKIVTHSYQDFTWRQFWSS